MLIRVGECYCVCVKQKLFPCQHPTKNRLQNRHSWLRDVTCFGLNDLVDDAVVHDVAGGPAQPRDQYPMDRVVTDVDAGGEPLGAFRHLALRQPGAPIADLFELERRQDDDVGPLEQTIDKSLQIRFNKLDLTGRAQMFSSTRFNQRFSRFVARQFEKPEDSDDQ